MRSIHFEPVLVLHGSFPGLFRAIMTPFLPKYNLKFICWVKIYLTAESEQKTRSEINLNNTGFCSSLRNYSAKTRAPAHQGKSLLKIEHALNFDSVLNCTYLALYYLI